MVVYNFGTMAELRLRKYCGIFVFLMCLWTPPGHCQTYSPIRGGDSVPYNVINDNDDTFNATLCELSPVDSGVHDYIKELLQQNTRLLEYDIVIDGYDEDPLLKNMAMNYRTNVWHRVFSKHGSAILTLAFHYDVLSLTMLTFGVEHLNVTLEDEPKGCFGKLSEKQKIQKLRSVLMTDFAPGANNRLWISADDSICHQVMTEAGGYAEFVFQCCSGSEDNIKCSEKAPDFWIILIYTVIGLIKVCFLLFGPLFFLQTFHDDLSLIRRYIVKLKDDLQVRISLEEPPPKTDNDTFENIRSNIPKLGNGQKYGLGTKFTKCASKAKSEHSEDPTDVLDVTVKKLHIYVDEQQLMPKDRVPVGLFRYLFQNIFRCGICDIEPFATCSRQTILGTYIGNCSCFGPCKNSKKCSRYGNWKHLASIVGGILLIIFIPFPFYLRVILYEVFEAEEVAMRHNIVESQGLELKYDHSLLHYFGTANYFFILIYVVYFITAFFCGILFNQKYKFGHFLQKVIDDTENIEAMEGIRLMVAHFVLPFEKFGCCGLIVGIFYWPIMLAVSLLITVFYIIPTIYLTFRFLIPERPSCFKRWPFGKSVSKRRKEGRIPAKAKNLEEYFLLEDISFTEPQINLAPRRAAGRMYTLCLGICCVILMYTILLMYAECFGYIVETLVFTLMGTVVNASIASRYFMLIFWILMYSHNCFKTTYEEYLQLNGKIFDYINQKLGGSIKEVTRMREDKQRNTAFKYICKEDLKEEAAVEADLIGEHVEVPKVEDSLEVNQEGELTWVTKNLVMFVDKKDIPKIPRDLFYDLTEVEAPGCPGPIYTGLMRAFKRLSYMVIFLLFVTAIVMSFGNMYKVSSTSQMLLTLAGGFVPFVVRFVLTPVGKGGDLNTYSFEGKIHEHIMKFQQNWTPYDLKFHDSEPCEDHPVHGGGQEEQTAIIHDDGKTDVMGVAMHTLDMMLLASHAEQDEADEQGDQAESSS